MKLFKLNYQHGNDEYGKVDIPLDQKGSPIRSGHGLTSEIYASASLIGTNQNLGDMVHCLGGELVLSKAALCVLNKFPLRAESVTVPTMIKTGKKDLGEYALISFSEILDVLDHDKSVFRLGRRTPVPIGVTEPVLSMQKIPDVDLFFADFLWFVCSERLKTAIESAGLENFEFTRLDIL